MKFKIGKIFECYKTFNKGERLLDILKKDGPESFMGCFGLWPSKDGYAIKEGYTRNWLTEGANYKMHRRTGFLFSYDSCFMTCGEFGYPFYRLEISLLGKKLINKRRYLKKRKIKLKK